MSHAAGKYIALALLATLVAGCGRHPPLADAERPELNNVVALRSALGGGAAEIATTAAAPAAEPTGWATLKGRFAIEGTPPPRQPLTVDKDQAVCAPGGKVVR